MRDYELVVIFGAERIATLAASHIDAVADRVSAEGGEINSVNSWGKRKLSYPIRGEREGYYVLFEFSAGPMQISNLERGLRLSEDVMRFMVTRHEPSPSPVLATEGNKR